MRKSTTAISAGALTLALGGGTALLLATPAAASPPRVTGCEPDGRSLSGLTGGVCDLLGGVARTVDEYTGDRLKPVTGTVENLAGDKLKPVTDAVNDLTGGKLKPVTDVVGETAGKIPGHSRGQGRPPAAVSPPKKPRATSSSAKPSQASDRADEDDGGGDDLLGLPLGCLPLLTPPDCGEAKASPEPTAPAGSDRSTPEPAAPASPRAPRGQASPPPSKRPAPASSGTPADPAELGGTVERAIPSATPSWPPRADVETPPLIPLWPGQPVPVLSGRLDGRKLVPSRPQDAAGTALTAVLLGSAILAARIVQARRREDRPRSMPFDGMRAADTGRHRLA
jgi:hypothetical protein